MESRSALSEAERRETQRNAICVSPACRPDAITV